MKGVVSWLNLHLFIPVKDIRKIIWKYLDKFDRVMVKAAHSQTLRMDLKYADGFRYHIFTAVQRGHTGIFCYLAERRNIHPLLDGIVLCAIENENISVLSWLRKRSYDMNSAHFKRAIDRRLFKVLKWHIDTCGHSFEYQLWCEYAIEKKLMDMFEWLLDNGVRFRSQTLGLLYKDNHLDELQRLIDNRKSLLKRFKV